MKKNNNYIDAEEDNRIRILKSKKPYFDFSKMVFRCECGKDDVRERITMNCIIHCRECKNVYWIPNMLKIIELKDKDLKHE